MSHPGRRSLLPLTVVLATLAAVPLFPGASAVGGGCFREGVCVVGVCFQGVCAQVGDPVCAGTNIAFVVCFHEGDFVQGTVALLVGLTTCNVGCAVTVAPSGDAHGSFLGVAPDGNASGLVALSGTGDASGGVLGASVRGAASGTVAASLEGDAHGDTLAVSGTGNTTAPLQLSGCFRLHLCGRFV